MPYANVSELPPAVRAKLKGKKRRQWMHVWNSEFRAHGDESRAFVGAWSAVKKELVKMQVAQNAPTPFSLWIPFAKVDKDRRTVSGYATTPDRDMDGEIVTLDAVKAALPDYMAWGNIREMHTNKAVGAAVREKTHMDTKGLWLTAKIVDDDAWKKCISDPPVYQGFSIGGRKEAVAEKDPSTITAIKLVEISIVDRPANPSCRFDVNKRAKPGEVAHLLKVPSHERAVRKMAEAVELLAKAGPPAAHDGFSLPAKKRDMTTEPDLSISAPCKEHGVTDCPECMEKRDFDAKARREAASSGAAMEDGSFPIYNQKDLDNAVGLRGNSNHSKAKVEAHIKSRARALGLKNPFKSKREKKARKLAKRQALAALAESASLSLPAIEADGPVESGHELDLGGGEGGAAPFLTLRKRKTRSAEKVNPDTLERFIMSVVQNGGAPTLEAVLRKAVAKARMPTRAQRMMRAGRDLKKARKAAKDMEECMKAVHAMHKAAYLAKMTKASKGKKPDDDGDEFDHQGAMEKLQKAYSLGQTLKTMMKSVKTNLQKAAGRSGERGQEAGDAEPGFYEVPPGVKDLSPSQMARTSPGGNESGSEPPIQALDVEWKGAGAGKRLSNMIQKGYVSASEADAMARAAAAEAKVEVLEKLPANGGGRRPVLFDARQLTGPNGGSRAAALMEGVDQAGLYSDDESLRKSAVGTLIGNMVFSGAGKSVLDPEFRGRGGI